MEPMKRDHLDDECPICFETIPYRDQGKATRMTCCGKLVCSPCSIAEAHRLNPTLANKEKFMGLGGEKYCVLTCPMCRSPQNLSGRESFDMLMMHAKNAKAWACFQLGNLFEYGEPGVVKVDKKNAFIYHLMASRLGDPGSSRAVGIHYYEGGRVKQDIVAAVHYFTMGSLFSFFCETVFVLLSTSSHILYDTIYFS